MNTCIINRYCHDDKITILSEKFYAYKMYFNKDSRTKDKIYRNVQPIKYLYNLLKQPKTTF